MVALEVVGGLVLAALVLAVLVGVAREPLVLLAVLLAMAGIVALMVAPARAEAAALVTQVGPGTAMVAVDREAVMVAVILAAVGTALGVVVLVVLLGAAVEALAVRGHRVAAVGLGVLGMVVVALAVVVGQHQARAEPMALEALQARQGPR